jgi:DNA (cytosine-5)-methyltransferase 1
MFTVASFFTGIGGIDLAFAWAGFDIRFQCEIDEYCQQVLKKHRPTYWQNAVIKGDIHEVTKREVGKVDVIVGGFPCQDISIAGKREGIRRGNRSGLWFELLRIIREVRPKVILLENVAAIAVPTDDGQPAPGLIVAATLAEIGYDCQWQFVRASDIGAPQQRERGISKRSLVRQSKRAVGSANFDSSELSNTTNRGISGGQRLKSNARKHSRLRGTHSLTGQKRLKSRLGRTAHGLSRRMDRHNGQFPARPNEPQYAYEPSRVTDVKLNRVARIKALGNAVVPQQVYPFALAIKEFLAS